MTVITTHNLMLDEIFDKINSSTDVVEAIRDNLDNIYFSKYLEFMVNDRWSNIDLEQAELGISKYQYHRSLAGAFLLNRHTFNIFNIVIMSKDSSQRVKQIQYKALSEMLYEGEAKIMNAIITKDITSLYPNVTFDLINEALDKG